jgi:hypothetical protein
MSGNICRAKSLESGGKPLARLSISTLSGSKQLHHHLSVVLASLRPGKRCHFGDVMNQKNLIELAKRYFICDTGLSVPNLVRKIQAAEGNPECFSTGRKTCSQMSCRWRKECLSDPEECEEAGPIDS